MEDAKNQAAVEKAAKKPKLDRKAKLAIAWTLVIVGSVVAAVGVNMFLANRGVVYSDKSSVASVTADIVLNGKLTDVAVKVGDIVRKDQVVGTVENVPVKAKMDGLVVAVSDKIGEAVSPANPVVRIADLKDTWIEVKVGEDKVAPIQVGQRARFVADAYPDDTVQAIVAEISPQSDSGGLVFSISDKRETKQFVVKLRYDVDRFTKLRPGMSAKAWIRTR